MVRQETVTPLSESDPEGPQLGAARILVVEDERLVAISLQRQLQSLGFEVVGLSASGESAIQNAGILRPDVVLMDINLEGELDGVDAAAEIYKQFQIPVIYLTAYSNREILDRAKVTEPLGYILKPYEARELQVVIETALYRYRAEHERSTVRDGEPGERATALSPLEAETDGRIAELTPREAEVMHLIVAGKTQKQIAAELGITIQTAAKHRAKVLEKLHVSNDVELVRLAMTMAAQWPKP